ncbi:hypothetical protein [Niveispirillum sp.]|uniref:hypothetical protein n=1 Tax=Niveispirillum sp. TaxID=1917217 RepID=UPI001B5805C7|nr:hypothetical protein [Niveispirillum sp.]MBP7336883.1 hypothetical protein [Niveispirillum sp.]
MADAATPATIPSALNLSDLNTTVNHEPRVSHVRLAQVLGVADARAILRLIERNRAELERYGSISVTVTENTDAIGRGRPGKTYWLNEPQALLVCIRSDAPQAPAVRQSLIQVYMDWRRGQLAPAATDMDGRPLALTEPEIMAALAFRRAVQKQADAEIARLRRDVGTALSSALDRAIIGEFQRREGLV